MTEKSAVCLYRTDGGMIAVGCEVGSVIVGGGFVATVAGIWAVTNMTCFVIATSTVGIASRHLPTALAYGGILRCLLSS